MMGLTNIGFTYAIPVEVGLATALFVVQYWMHSEICRSSCDLMKTLRKFAL